MTPKTPTAAELAAEVKRLARRLSDASYVQGTDERYESVSRDRKNDDKVRALLKEVADATDALAALAPAAEGVEPSSAKDSLLRLVCDIRFAVGDNGKRMQPELVEYLKALKLDADRYQLLRAEAYEAVIPHGGKLGGSRTAWITKMHPGPSFDAAIDAARGIGGAR